jgi:hypothetical protein
MAPLLGLFSARDLEFFGYALFQPFAFIYGGMKVAPGYKRQTGTVLAVLWLLILIAVVTWEIRLGADLILWQNAVAAMLAVVGLSVSIWNLHRGGSRYRELPMNLFKRKPQVFLDDLCRDYYDGQILDPVVGAVLYDQARESVIDVDSTFASVDSTKFTREMILINFEMFALAWLYQLGEDHVVAQSAFTKNYLITKGMQNAWDELLT